MKRYRVQVMVGVDVEADTPGEAMSHAISKVRAELGEDISSPHPKTVSVSGIAMCGPEFGHTAIYGYMVFELPPASHIVDDF